MSARSRKSRKVSVGMLSISVRHSLPSWTGVLPVFTTCFGPRTAAAGFNGATWPVMNVIIREIGGKGPRRTARPAPYRVRHEEPGRAGRVSASAGWKSGSA
jgi:hypothetical protein